MTHDQLTELLTLAFKKLSAYEEQKQHIFNEIAHFPERKMVESLAIKNISIAMQNKTVRPPITPHGSIYEQLKSGLI
jgi:hypothetical protein